MSTSSQKAFTLIEMLIVIVIIGILAAALVPRLQDVQGRARDTKRKADIQQIHNALIIQYLDTGKYPTGQLASYDYSYQTGWLSVLTGIMSSIPVDPINNGGSIWTTTGNYTYAYGNVTTQRNTFSLFTKFENRKDPERCEVKNVQFTQLGITYNCNDPTNCGILCPYMYFRSELTQ